MDHCKTFFLLKGVLCKNVYFLDIALINDSVGLSQFLVILWPFSCVIISLSKYLPISTKFGTHIPQCNTSGWFFVFFFEFSIFTVFIDFFSFLGLSQFLRWNLDHFQIEFLWFLWGKWTILRLLLKGVQCAVQKRVFLDIALINGSL